MCQSCQGGIEGKKGTKVEIKWREVRMGPLWAPKMAMGNWLYGTFHEHGSARNAVWPMGGHELKLILFDSVWIKNCMPQSRISQFMFENLVPLLYFMYLKSIKGFCVCVCVCLSLSPPSWLWVPSIHVQIRVSWKSPNPKKNNGH
jgi:hypothetical protein